MATTITRTIKATSKSGNEIEIEITRTIGVEKNDIGLDGYVFETEKMADRLTIHVKVDGKHYTSSYEAPSKLQSTGIFAKPDLIAKGGYAKLGAMILTEERYNEVMAVIAEMEAELTTPEYAAYLIEKAEDAARSEAEDLAEAKEIADRNAHPGWCNKCHSYCYGDCSAN